MGYFSNPNDKGNLKITMLIKEWISNKILLNEESYITVTEVQCAVPGCPDVETMIIIFDKNDQHIYKIGKPINYIRKWDIDALKLSAIQNY